jgi:hypothetical protein
MCCASGKVKLPELHSPPEPLSTFLSGVTRVSKHSLENICKYNSCFQMTSFGATNVVRENYMPTFRVQGQIYHRAGSLLPLSDADHKFLQIYFMANSDEQIEQQCHYNAGTRWEIVDPLQGLFDQHNELVRLFKNTIQRMPAEDYAVVIRADKRPVGQHERQFNAPTIDEVAIVIVGKEFESRDIILHRRSGDIQRVSETHRSYDGLQYPILFWRGDDGYHFNIKMRNPQTGEGTNKKVSAMNYYSYRLMICQNAENRILKCRQLFHQYIVDMYARLKTNGSYLFDWIKPSCFLKSTSIYETQSLMMVTWIQTNWEEWSYYRLHSRGVHGTRCDDICSRTWSPRFFRHLYMQSNMGWN